MGPKVHTGRVRAGVGESDPRLYLIGHWDPLKKSDPFDLFISGHNAPRRWTTPSWVASAGVSPGYILGGAGLCIYRPPPLSEPPMEAQTARGGSPLGGGLTMGGGGAIIGGGGNIYLDFTSWVTRERSHHQELAIAMQPE